MTTEELKQEAIKKAYGEYSDTFKENIDNEGWIDAAWIENIEINIDIKAGFDRYGTESTFIRPKSLAGIETNNGWIRIEEDGSNLPDFDSKDEFWICNKNGFFDWISNAKQIYTKFNNGTLTHCQPILKPKLPIY